MENKDIRYVYRLKREDIATVVSIGSGDLHILKAYKGHLNIPIRTVLHHMIGTAAKCWEEKHDTYIQELEKRNRVLDEIVVTYLQKYGKIRPKGLETPVEGAKEEETEEKGKPADKDAPPEQ